MIRLFTTLIHLSVLCQTRSSTDHIIMYSVRTLVQRRRSVGAAQFFRICG